MRFKDLIAFWAGRCNSVNKDWPITSRIADTDYVINRRMVIGPCPPILQSFGVLSDLERQQFCRVAASEDGNCLE